MGGTYGVPSYDSLLADARGAVQSPEPVSMDALRSAGAPRARESHLVRALMTAVPHVLGIPQRAMGASEAFRTGGEYNPGPVLEAAALGLPNDPNMLRGLVARRLMRGGPIGQSD